MAPTLFFNEIDHLPHGIDLPGGIMIIKKTVLRNCGNFPEFLGMKGGSVGYGEENYIQARRREKGKIIGFCPDLILEHLDTDQKLKLSWHLKRKFAKGRDIQVLKIEDGYAEFAKVLFRLTNISFIHLFRKLPK